MDVAGSDTLSGVAAREVSRKSYDAFISYAHDADEAFAPVLQRGLQHLAKPVEPPTRYGGVPGRDQSGCQSRAVVQHPGRT